MNEVTERFIEAYDRLIRDHLVSDQKAFASKIGVSTSMITEILKGRSNVGLVAIQNTVLYFNINPNWLFTGKGEIYQTCILSEPPLPYDKKLIDLQTETIETQRKYIQLLEEQLKKIKEVKEKPAESGQKRKAV